MNQPLRQAPAVPRGSLPSPWERLRNVVGRYRQTAGGWAATSRRRGADPSRQSPRFGGRPNRPPAGRADAGLRPVAAAAGGAGGGWAW